MKTSPFTTVFMLLTMALLAGCYSRRSEPFRGPLEINSPSLANGQTKFMMNCHKCHPSGEAGLGPALNPLPSPRFLKAFQIRHGLGAMPAFKKDELSKQDVRDITLYMKALRHNTR